VDRTEPRHAPAGGGTHTPRTVALDPAADRPPRAGPGRIGLRNAGAVLGASLFLVALGAAARATPVGAATVPTLAAAGTHPGDLLTLVSQSAWVEPTAASAQMSLALRITSRMPRTDLSLSLTVYRRLTTRSGFDETLSGHSLGSVLTRSPALAVSALTTDAGGVTRLSVPVQGAGAPSQGGVWTADLGCAPDSCAGVYPVKVALSDSASDTSSPAAQLITYLVYDQPSTSTVPLRVALVVPLGLPPSVAGGAGTADSPPAGAVSALAGLVSDIAGAPTVPLTLVPEPATVNQLDALKRDRTVGAMSTLSLSSARQTLASTFVPVDATGLVDAGLGGELTAQVKRGGDVLGANAVRAAVGTWVSTSALDQDTLNRLAPPVTHVVVPQGSVSGPTGPLTPTQPFALGGGRSTTVTAMTADPGLDAHLAAASGRDPALAAQQFLADLALVYYESPYLRGPRGTTATRGLVAVAPAAWAPGAGFVTAVLSGLQGNPVVTPVTLDELFAQVPVGADGQPTSRHPVSGGTRSPPASTVRAARARQDAFASSAMGSIAGATVARLGDLLLAAESQTLSARAQRSALAGYDAALDRQLRQLSVRSDTIRLTAGTASVPITVIRNTAYPVTVDVRLTSDKLQFPVVGNSVPGAMCQAPVVQSSAGRSTFSALCVLDHTTNAVYVNMRARTAGDFRIDVTLMSPQGALVLAAGHLTVRSLSTSAVAIGLSAAAGAVLLFWWGRTLWRGKWGRRGAHAQGASRAGT
jgi:hypothetical protein